MRDFNISLIISKIGKSYKLIDVSEEGEPKEYPVSNVAALKSIFGQLVNYALDKDSPYHPSKVIPQSMLNKKVEISELPQELISREN
jgi:hypothetical protein